MTMDAKQLIRGLLRNLLLAAVVFLPLFLVLNVAELKLRGVGLSEAVWYHSSGAAVVYLGLLLPVLLGAVVHSATLVLIPSGAAERTRRVAAIALATLVPCTVVLSELAPYLSDFPGSAAIATLVYGLICAARMGQGPATGKAAQRADKA
jgi:hypothetical protein